MCFKGFNEALGQAAVQIVNEDDEGRYVRFFEHRREFVPKFANT